MQLDTDFRSRLAAGVLAALAASVPGSKVGLQGSLSENGGDQFSDIDVFWEVPDDSLDSCLNRIAYVLSGVCPLESLRLDPELANSAKRRLVYARFKDVPLFWRLDLEVFARSIGQDRTYDLDNPLARTSEWSRTESALANAVAVVKQHLRDNDDEALWLLGRAYKRVELGMPGLEIRDLILRLASGVRRVDTASITLAERIEGLVQGTS